MSKIFSKEEILCLTKDNIGSAVHEVIDSHEALRAKLDITANALEEISTTFEIDWNEAQEIAREALAQIQIESKGNSK